MYKHIKIYVLNMANEKVLVVAFDGMDKELIEQFGLENITQEEFGRIDNTTGIYRRMTSELFASFITGETHEEHGIKDLKTSVSKRNRFLKWLFPKPILDYVKGTHTLREVLMDNNGKEELKYTKNDLEIDTIFEKIDASLPLYIPSYNPSMYWLSGIPHNVIKYFNHERFEKEARHDTELRLEKGSATQPAFFDVTKKFWDFIMLHLHDPDGFQDTKIGNLEEEYKRLDEIAGRILEEYSDWTVIFMSDHGRPLEGAGPHDHNENAFYSCNKELFGEKTPHITSFYDKIMDLTNE